MTIKFRTMININIRNKNRIVILDSPGKTPIRGRTTASLYFHTPLDLLLAALGLCVGGNIIEYCRFNDLNTKIFEEIIVYLDNSVFIVNIKRPKNFEKTHEDRLKRTMEECQIAKELSKDIKIVFEDNTIPTEKLLKELPKSCCGG